MPRSIRPAHYPAATLVTAAVFAFGPAVHPADGLAGQGTVATGTLTAIWGDPPASSPAGPATVEPSLHWILFDDHGKALEVEIGPDLLRRSGGIRGLDRRRVRADGILERGPAADRAAHGILRASDLRVHDTRRPAPPALTGSRPYAVIMCKFADIADEPRTPSFVETLMGDGYPNMSHYYFDASGGRMDLAGTRVFGWFTLPEPQPAYFDGSGTVVSLNRVADDCLASVSDVDLRHFSGIILQFNGSLSATGWGMAWGGSRVIAMDGEARVWPFVWMPAWALDDSRYGIYAHEIGHSLGLPHSSGPNAATYDSSWDVMSRPYLVWDPALRAWIPGGTIAFHKALLGWIPEDGVVTASGATPRQVVLHPHSDGRAGRGTMMVRIPIPGTPDFYTVEARRQTGYDRGLPAAALIMHRVPDPYGPDCTLNRCARVVATGKQGDPAGGAAVWGPGDEFDDGVVSVRFAVGGATGWDVVVSVAVPDAPSGLTTERAADALFRDGSLTPEELEYLDMMGNRNGRYDLGDFLAFIRSQHP